MYERILSSLHALKLALICLLSFFITLPGFVYAKSPTFFGFQLGMTQDDVAQVVKSNGYQYGPDPIGGPVQTIYIYKNGKFLLNFTPPYPLSAVQKIKIPSISFNAKEINDNFIDKFCSSYKINIDDLDVKIDNFDRKIVTVMDYTNGIGIEFVCPGLGDLMELYGSTPADYLIIFAVQSGSDYQFK